jgi:hypothetical protein
LRVRCKIEDSKCDSLKAARGCLRMQAYAETTYNVILSITSMYACPAASLGGVSAASMDVGAPAPAPAARRLLRA